MIEHIKSGWLVLLLALGFGAALAGVQTTLGPIIEQNQKDETFTQIPSLVLGADSVAGKTVTTKGNTITVGEETTLTVEPTVIDSPPAPYMVYRVSEGDRLAGWVLRVSGQGYGDTIVALLGLDADAETIVSVYVLDQKETPGLGSKIAGPWNRQFDGKPTARPLEVVKTDPEQANQIEAISGATISSAAMTNLVNKGVFRFKNDLSAGRVNTGSEEPHAR